MPHEDEQMGRCKRRRRRSIITRAINRCSQVQQVLGRGMACTPRDVHTSQEDNDTQEEIPTKPEPSLLSDLKAAKIPRYTAGVLL